MKFNEKDFDLVEFVEEYIENNYENFIENEIQDPEDIFAELVNYYGVDDSGDSRPDDPELCIPRNWLLKHGDEFVSEIKYAIETHDESCDDGTRLNNLIEDWLNDDTRTIINDETYNQTIVDTLEYWLDLYNR